MIDRERLEKFIKWIETGVQEDIQQAKRQEGKDDVMANRYDAAAKRGQYIAYKLGELLKDETDKTPGQDAGKVRSES